MGLGNCCCAGESCGGLGYPSTITSYHGLPSTVTQDYFNLDYFKQRKSDQELTGVRSQFANYIYDIDTSSKYIAMACGSAGARFCNRTSEGNKNASYKFRNQGVFKRSQTGFGDRTFNGIQSKTFFAGNEKGDRYGFELNKFSGVYGVCISGNYLITANGTNGVWLLDLSKANTSGVENSGIQLIGGRADTIINNVKVHSGILYVGTCGYDKPKYSYSNLILQENYQPEYNSNNQFFGSNLYSNDVHLYDFDKLLYSQGNPYLQRIETNGKNVNAISASGGKVYVATGKRYSPSDGLYGGGDLIKIEKNSETKLITSSIIYSSAIGSILDVDVDGSDVYCVDSNYGVIKNGNAWININSGGILSANLQSGVSPCVDTFVNCSYSAPGGGWFAPIIRYSGTYSAKIISLDLPSLGRDILQTCPPYNKPYRTRETIGIFPSSLKVTKNSITVGLYQGGIATYNKTLGSLVSHNPSIITLPDCSFFRTRASLGGAPSGYDANYEYTLSVGKMACIDNFVYAIDSVQYVANGAGPGVYNPIERTERVMTKSTLIKGYELASGILEFNIT